jgi:hypothetical protein
MLALSSPPRYLWKGLNYNMAFLYSWQALDDQAIEPGGQIADLDSYADAYGLYALPVLGYTFGPPLVTRDGGFNFRLGLGLGLGWILAQGEIVLDRDPGKPRVAFDVNQAALAAVALGEARWRSYGLRMMVEAPSIEQDGLRFSFLKTSLSLAYSFTPEEFEAQPQFYMQAAQQGLSPWTWDLEAFAGSRPLPVVSSIRYNPDNITAPGGGLQLAFKKRHWPLQMVAAASYWAVEAAGPATDFFDVPGTTRNARLRAAGTGLDLGFRNSWRENKRMRPFTTGGINLLWASHQGEIGGLAVEDSGMAFGFWLGGGLRLVLFKHLDLAGELRGLDATSTHLGVRHRTFGLQGQFNLGYHY